MRSLMLAIAGFILLLMTPALAESDLGLCSRDGVMVSSNSEVGDDEIESAPAVGAPKDRSNRMVVEFGAS